MVVGLKPAEGNPSEMVLVREELTIDRVKSKGVLPKALDALLAESGPALKLDRIEVGLVLKILEGSSISKVLLKGSGNNLVVEDVSTGFPAALKGKTGVALEKTLLDFTLARGDLQRLTPERQKSGATQVKYLMSSGLKKASLFAVRSSGGRLAAISLSKIDKPF
jgi:hypothetical protein